MRSIFLKIFLSFWLIQALILGMALLLAEHPAERVVSRWRFISSDALKHYNETAASFLEQGGIKAADEYLQQLASGDFSARAAETERKDEISELVHDFNRMARRLEALVNSQKQLMSDISHELRSPLARLNVALGLARQRASEDVGKALDRIELEAQRLNDLIGKLLTLARLESGEQAPEQSWVNIPDLLKDVIGDADFEAHSRKSRVKL